MPTRNALLRGAHGHRQRRQQPASVEMVQHGRRTCATLVVLLLKLQSQILVDLMEVCLQGAEHTAASCSVQH